MKKNNLELAKSKFNAECNKIEAMIGVLVKDFEVDDTVGVKEYDAIVAQFKNVEQASEVYRDAIASQISKYDTDEHLDELENMFQRITEKFMDIYNKVDALSIKVAQQNANQPQ